jgi:signal transduction histidine kinase
MEIHRRRIMGSRGSYALSDIIGSLCCLAFMVVELAVTPELSISGIIFIVIYSLLLVCLPAKPTISCVGMVILNAVITVIPVEIVGPTAFWGTWFALGLLARRETVWIACLCVTVNIVATMSAAIIYYGSVSIGTVGLSCSYMVSFLVGFAIQKQAVALRIQKERELSEQRLLFQDERLENLHVLHDQVAGDLTHIVQRCRLWISDPSISMDEKSEISEVEAMVDDVLHRLRTNVIEPARKTLERHHEEAGVDADARNIAESISSEPVEALAAEASKNADNGSRGMSTKLAEQACRAQRRLSALGFIGHIDIDGDCDQLTAKQLTAVSRLMDELSNNIARHGKPGEYLFRIGLGIGGFGILASNLCVEGENDLDLSGGVGLRLIARTVEGLGGDIQTNTEDGEWTIAIRVTTDEQWPND